MPEARLEHKLVQFDRLTPVSSRQAPSFGETRPREPASLSRWPLRLSSSARVERSCLPRSRLPGGRRNARAVGRWFKFRSRCLQQVLSRNWDLLRSLICRQSKRRQCHRSRRLRAGHRQPVHRWLDHRLRRWYRLPPLRRRCLAPRDKRSSRFGTKRKSTGCKRRRKRLARTAARPWRPTPCCAWCAATIGR